MSPTTQKRLNGKRNKKVERLLMTERPESQHIVNILYILTQYGQSRRGINPATNVMIYVYTYMRFIHMGFTHSQHNSLLHINWLCVSSLTNPHQLAKGRTILFFFFLPLQMWLHVPWVLSKMEWANQLKHVWPKLGPPPVISLIL